MHFVVNKRMFLGVHVVRRRLQGVLRRRAAVEDVVRLAGAGRGRGGGMGLSIAN